MSDWVVCVTGGIGSGKSAVAGMFEKQGASVVDMDGIAHQLTECGGAALPLLVEAFGPGILNEKGAMDRPKMRQLAFSSLDTRRLLEQILHPMIRRQADEACRQAVSAYVLLLIPLLVERIATEGNRLGCKRILVVDCDESQQIERVMARSRLSEREVQAIVAAQASRQERLAIADDVIFNVGTFKQLEGKVLALHEKYMTLANNS